jgi:hypothetical protein
MRTRRGLPFVAGGGMTTAIAATAWMSLRWIGQRPFARTAEWGYRAYRRGW